MSDRPFPNVAARLLAALLIPALGLAACTTYEPFDSGDYLKDQYHKRLEPPVADKLEVPFELSDELRALVHQRIKPSTDVDRRIEQVQEFIHYYLGLEYELTPTRNAVQTFHDAKGNCMSFTNLFIGVAREMRLDPFYVEVTDFNRWNYRDGMVLSQGHIVAGLYVDGKLHTYDFLPYRPKTYKEFKQIDDVTAAAHYYNNLAAEALMRGDDEKALEWVQIATRIAPEFTKAINNYGVTLARMGRVEEALDAYQRGLEVDPGDVAILSNMVRAYQRLGRHAEAEATLEKIESFQNTNPFFFLYRGELALAENRPEEALEYMRQAFRRETEIPEIHLGLVKTYMALGDLDRARHHLERALKLDATNAEALKLARLLQQPSS